jgi:hypothetical protein
MIFSSFSVSLLEDIINLIKEKKKKALSKSFVDLIIINTVVQFAYAKSRGIDITETS